MESVIVAGPIQRYKKMQHQQKKKPVILLSIESCGPATDWQCMENRLSQMYI